MMVFGVVMVKPSGSWIEYFRKSLSPNYHTSALTTKKSSLELFVCLFHNADKVSSFSTLVRAGRGDQEFCTTERQRRTTELETDSNLDGLS